MYLAPRQKRRIRLRGLVHQVKAIHSMQADFLIQRFPLNHRLVCEQTRTSWLEYPKYYEIYIKEVVGVQCTCVRNGCSSCVQIFLQNFYRLGFVNPNVGLSKTQGSSWATIFTSKCRSFICYLKYTSHLGFRYLNTSVQINFPLD